MERIFARHGLEISRQTMCGWSLAAADALLPLYQLMKSVILASRVIHHDDTPVDLRDAHKKLKQRAYFWAVVGDEEHPLIALDFTMSHSSAGPVAFLEPFRGYLQADAASVYKAKLAVLCEPAWRRSAAILFNFVASCRRHNVDAIVILCKYRIQHPTFWHSSQSTSALPR
jgi:hypothetical protein